MSYPHQVIVERITEVGRGKKLPAPVFIVRDYDTHKSPRIVGYETDEKLVRKVYPHAKRWAGGKLVKF